MMDQNDFKIYKWNNIYGFLPYLPRIDNLRQLPKDDGLKKSTEWVFDFKRRGSHTREVKEMAGFLAEKLKCDKIVAIPPSSIEKQPNSLQQIYGNHINRIEDVETRKWKHNKKIPDDYVKSFTFTGISKGEKILIIDDVCTTGKTLQYYNDFFRSIGFITAMACVAFHHKLDFKEVESVEPLTQQANYIQEDVKNIEAYNNLTEVYTYLEENGWKVSKDTVYKHARAGKLKPDGAGKYTKKNVDFYAESFLHQKSTVRKSKSEELQRKKLEEELRGKKLQNEREYIRLMQDKGRLIEKEIVYLHFATLAVGLENAIKGQIQTEAGEAVNLIDDSDDKARKYVEISNEIVDRALNEFSKLTNIEAIFGVE